MKTRKEGKRNEEKEDKKSGKMRKGVISFIKLRMGRNKLLELGTTTLMLTLAVKVLGVKMMQLFM